MVMFGERVDQRGNPKPGFTACHYSVEELEILVDILDIYKEELKFEYSPAPVPDDVWEEAMGLRKHTKARLDKARRKADTNV